MVNKKYTDTASVQQKEKRDSIQFKQHGKLLYNHIFLISEYKRHSTEKNILVDYMMSNAFWGKKEKFAEVLSQINAQLLQIYLPSLC